MKVNDTVGWKWGNGIAEGVVEKISDERTEITSKGKQVVRNGTPDNRAVVIRHSSGTKVLKLESEIQQTS